MFDAALWGLIKPRIKDDLAITLIKISFLLICRIKPQVEDFAVCWIGSLMNESRVRQNYLLHPSKPADLSSSKSWSCYGPYS